MTCNYAGDFSLIADVEPGEEYLIMVSDVGWNGEPYGGEVVLTMEGLAEPTVETNITMVTVDRISGVTFVRGTADCDSVADDAAFSSWAEMRQRSGKKIHVAGSGDQGFSCADGVFAIRMETDRVFSGRVAVKTWAYVCSFDICGRTLTDEEVIRVRWA